MTGFLSGERNPCTPDRSDGEVEGRKPVAQGGDAMEQGRRCAVAQGRCGQEAVTVAQEGCLLSAKQGLPARCTAPETLCQQHARLQAAAT